MKGQTKKEVTWEKLEDNHYVVFLKEKDLYLESTILKLTLIFSLTLILSIFGMREKPNAFFDISGPMKILFIVSFIALPCLLAFRFRDKLKERLFHVTVREKEIIDYLGNILLSQDLSRKDEGKFEGSARFEYKILPNGLEITAYTYGTGLVDKIRELDRALEDRFAMELISKRDQVDSVVYTLKYMGNGGRLVAPVVGSRVKEGEIPIDTGLTWKIDKSPHGLIAGNTGGGKTYFIFYLIAYFIKKDYTLYICDPKRSDLTMAENYFLGRNVFLEYSTGGIAKNIRLVKEAMLERYEEIANTHRDIGFSYKDLGYKPIILLIDEFGGYLASCDKKVKSEVVDNLKQIIFQGRQAGVFVILSTQKPDADTIPTNIRDQLGLRAVLGNMSDDGYRMVFGSNEGMSYKSRRPGEGYIYFDGIDSDRPIPFKAPLIEDLNELLRFSCRQNDDLLVPLRYPGDSNLG